MTNREIILHCLKENTDVTCRKYSCDKPEQEGNTGECCDKCALRILEEYEREVKSKAIDDCIKKIMQTHIHMPNDYANEITCCVKNEIKDIMNELKAGGE